ncbi:MAG: DinB family protein [Bacteroidota bacterium]
MKSENLIQASIEQTRQTINEIEKLKNKDLRSLIWKQAPTSWSVLECIEHLNLYGDHYLPEIEKTIKNSKTEVETEFKSGFLGNYFAKSMLPKEKLNKMKTFKDKNPLNANLDITAIDRFIVQQIKLIDLLDRARTVNLNKLKIKTSISPLLKFRLGDTFQFFINHIIRHLKQIERIQATYS